jgi:hypothetical protein
MGIIRTAIALALAMVIATLSAEESHAQDQSPGRARIAQCARRGSLALRRLMGKVTLLGVVRRRQTDSLSAPLQELEASAVRSRDSATERVDWLASNASALKRLADQTGGASGPSKGARTTRSGSGLSGPGVRVDRLLGVAKERMQGTLDWAGSGLRAPRLPLGPSAGEEPAMQDNSASRRSPTATNKEYPVGDAERKKLERIGSTSQLPVMASRFVFRRRDFHSRRRDIDQLKTAAIELGTTRVFDAGPAIPHAEAIRRGLQARAEILALAVATGFLRVGSLPDSVDPQTPHVMELALEQLRIDLQCFAERGTSAEVRTKATKLGANLNARFPPPSTESSTPRNK